MNDRLEQNKKAAKGFYDLLFNQCRPTEAIDRYTGDGKIVEHWDVLQVIPEKSANTNTMF